MSYTKYLFLAFVGIAAGCRNSHDETTKPAADTSTTVLRADTIPVERSIVKKDPVAIYTEKVPDELNNWVFAVHVYETKRRFHYIVRMQYKELRITDSINVPNFGIEPTVQIQKDNSPFSCTLGFTDKKGIFKPLSRASVKEERLRFKKVASYAVGVYRTSKWMVNGQWSMVNGQWSMVNGQWSMVNGQWSMVNGQWSMVNGQWSMVNKRNSTLMINIV